MNFAFQSINKLTFLFNRLAAAAAAAAGATSELSYLAALHPAYRPVPYDHPLYGANTLRGKFVLQPLMKVSISKLSHFVCAGSLKNIFIIYITLWKSSNR